MNLLNLVSDIQEELLFLPRTVKGRDPIYEQSVAHRNCFSLAAVAQDVDEVGGTAVAIALSYCFLLQLFMRWEAKKLDCGQSSAQIVHQR